jgi:glycine hydroxymethyltransferase
VADLVSRAVAAKPDTDAGRDALADIAEEVADLVAKFPAYPR